MKTPTNALQKLTILTVTLVLGLLGVSAAFAGTVDGCAAGNSLTAGNQVFPVPCNGVGPGLLLADMISPFLYTTTAGTNSGTIVSAVYSLNGTLDFYYQITNDASSATDLARLTATDFAGFATDPGFRTDGGTLGVPFFVDGDSFEVPTTADTTTGAVIGFSFYPLTTSPPEIAPGTTSAIVIISTDATQWTAGNVSIIDGGTDTVAAFQPTTSTSTPEPASLGLLGIGLIALGGLRRRYSR